MINHVEMRLNADKTKGNIANYTRLHFNACAVKNVNNNKTFFFVKNPMNETRVRSP